MTMPVKRRLAAILAADAVGYSRMMGADEEGTLRVLAAHRAVIDGIVAFHHGRTFGIAGDSVLAEFESAVEAVRCAVEIQEALKTRNDALPEGDRMLFRIGVNLGDVIVSGENLHGDGVNVAARLESIAEPGGVTISSSIYDQIAGKLNLSFVDVGSRELKNIAKPIHVYNLSGTAPARAHVPAAPAASGSRSSRSRAPLAAGAAIAVLALAAFAAWRAGWIAPAADEKVQTELARARAEVEEAKRRADAATGAEAKARADAILANARADAEAIRRKADAELAAGRKAQAAEPVKVAAPTTLAVARYDGDWTITRSCEAYQELPAQVQSWNFSVRDNDFLIEGGKAGQPGSSQMRGKPGGDGSLVLSGSGISRMKASQGERYAVFFEGRLDGERFLLKGRLGGRACTVVLTRALAVAASPYDGAWTATRTCEPFDEFPQQTSVIKLSVMGGEFAIEQGTAGQPGYNRARGSPKADGSLALSGQGISSAKRFRGQPYTVSYDGRFEDGRFVMKGTLGRRKCTLVLARG